MTYRIKNPVVLTKILWADFALGSVSGSIGLLFSDFFVPIFGLSSTVIISISAVTFLYSLFAFRLAKMTTTSIPQVRILIYANWAWTLISLGIIVFHFSTATLLGQFFLILQIIVVGGLAWLEGKQLKKISVSEN